MKIIFFIGFLLAGAKAQTETKPFSRQLISEVLGNNKNIVFSPISIYIALATALLGAEGKTAEEISKVLHSNGTSKDDIEGHLHFIASDFNLNSRGKGVNVEVANRIYLDQKYEIVSKFRGNSHLFFQTEAEQVNFGDPIAVANEINAWIEKQTNEKIKDIISPDIIDSSTVAVLANAFYFQGFWKNYFDFKNNMREDFHMRRGRTVTVSMMYLEDDLEYADLKDVEATSVKVPFANSDVSFIIFLPNEMDGLENMKLKFKSANHTKLNGEYKKSVIRLMLPRFRMKFDVSLNDVLEKLGLISMFHDDADFSSLTTSKESFKVSKVQHKAFIEVNEFGVEAAAATVMAMVPPATEFVDRSIIRYFKVNHPFTFAIASPDNIYFAGQVTNIPEYN